MIVAPSGKAIDSTTVTDSNRIIEHLDDLVPDTNPLFPGAPNDKAELRFWIDHTKVR